jgi:protein-L-isoaspartate(D-aspartate) O-methyltransferase
MNLRHAYGSLGLCCLLLIHCAGMPSSVQEREEYWRQQAQSMVTAQLAQRDIRDSRVLDAMARVPRHLFVPEEVRAHSYSDRPLPIGLNQTISQPYIVALMTQAAAPRAEDKALEIGAGSGYQAAVLAELVSEVYTIEIIPELGIRAERTLKELEYDNVHVRVGDGYEGWPEEAPFDVILVTAAAERVPPRLIEQLAEGGRLIMPKGRVGGIQTLIKLTRRNGELVEESITSVRFVPMTGRIQEEEP